MDTCIGQLKSASLVQHADGGWRYAPATPQLDDFAAKLERAYAERPVQIVNTIVAAPNARLQSFADAFRLGRKED